MSTHKEEPSAISFIQSHTKTQKERDALEDGELAAFNLDPTQTFTISMGAIARILSLRDQIVEECPTVDIAQIDKLEVYAKALYYSQTMYSTASKPAEALPALVARGTELRDQLLVDANALASHGLIDGSALGGIKGGIGYLNVSMDIGILVSTLRARWNDIKDKSAIEKNVLDEAWDIYERIPVANATRERHTQAVASAANDRTRAFTLLVRAYDQARRAISFLRWDEGDVDNFAPSLWTGRGGRAATSVTKPADPGSDTVAPTTPVPVPPDSNPATKPAVPIAPITPQANGMPGGSPFVHN